MARNRPRPLSVRSPNTGKRFFVQRGMTGESRYVICDRTKRDARFIGNMSPRPHRRVAGADEQVLADRIAELINLHGLTAP